MPSFFKSKNSSTPAETTSANWATRVRQGLSRTRDNLGKRLSGLLGGGKIDEALYEELETILLTADAGVNATAWLLDELRRQVKSNGLTDAAQLKGALQEALVALLAPLAQPLYTDAYKPFIIMLTGVNGAGKTTSIGKLANHFQRQGKPSCSLLVILFAPPHASNSWLGVNVICKPSSRRIAMLSKKGIPRR